MNGKKSGGEKEGRRKEETVGGKKKKKKKTLERKVNRRHFNSEKPRGESPSSVSLGIIATDLKRATIIIGSWKERRNTIFERGSSRIA